MPKPLFCPHPPWPKQQQFLELTCKEAFYGGAAGGGKSESLLMGALQFVNVPGYAALIVRRDTQRLQLAGGLIPRSHQWLAGTAAHWQGTQRRWTFPAGAGTASISFGYLRDSCDKFRYGSSEYQYIAFDELTEFPEEDYLFLFSRLRRTYRVDVPLRVRSASNPGGIGHAWVKRRFITDAAALPASADEPDGGMSIASAARRVARLLAEQEQKIVFAESCTGGLVAGALTKIPGISAHHCGGVVVYRNETKTAYLGISPEVLKKPGPVSAEVAAEMATRVLQKTPEATIAAAVTGHLGPAAPKRLDGVVFIGLACREQPDCQVQRLKLPPGGDRATRQKQVIEAVLALAAQKLEDTPHVCSADCQHHHHSLPPDRPAGSASLSPADWRELLRGEVDAVCLGGPAPGEGQLTSGAIFPGSFNPLHDGHRQMTAVAQKLLGLTVEFAISIENVDKPALTRQEVLRRAAQFEPEQAVWVVAAATFVELATLFPDTTFLVGVDTLVRIADPKYYDDPRQLRASLKYLAAQGARFLVFGRQHGGKFQTLPDLQFPAALRKLCQGVSEREFRIDMSSTTLRGKVVR